MNLNNEVILLRKSLKSIVNQTKLNLIKKIKQAKKSGKNVGKKEDEINCFKRLNITDIPLSHGLYPDRLNKTLTDSTSSEIDRIYARILSNPIIQRTLIKMKEAKGLEVTEKILQRNEKKIQQSVVKKIDQEVKEKIEKTSDKKIQSKDGKVAKDKKEKKESSTSKPGAFVKNPKFKGSVSSDESDSEEIEPASRSEDPFFVSNSGSNYMTVAPTILPESSDEEDQPPPQKKQFRQSNGNKQHERFNKPQEKPRNSFKVQERPKEVKVQISKEEPDIHPSWAAKQQQKKLQIQEFKGTKIKFDD